MESDKPTRARGLNNNATVLDDPDNRQRIITALRDGLSLSSAAAIVGITRDRVRKYRLLHPDFNDACATAAAEYEYALLRVATAGAMEDPRLALEVLARRFPSKWSTSMAIRRDVEDDEREVDDVSLLSDEELIAIACGQPL